MTEEQATLLTLTIVGFVVTAFGLWRIYRDARNEARAAQQRLKLMPELLEWERAIDARLKARFEAQGLSPASIDAGLNASRVVWDSVYARHGVVRPSYETLTELAARESQRLLDAVLLATRGDVAIALSGLSLSTIASACSLFLET